MQNLINTCIGEIKVNIVSLTSLSLNKCACIDVYCSNFCYYQFSGHKTPGGATALATSSALQFHSSLLSLLSGHTFSAGGLLSFWWEKQGVGVQSSQWHKPSCSLLWKAPAVFKSSAAQGAGEAVFCSAIVMKSLRPAVWSPQCSFHTVRFWSLREWNLENWVQSVLWHNKDNKEHVSNTCKTSPIRWRHKEDNKGDLK